MLFKPTSREPKQGICNIHMKKLMQGTLEGCKGEVIGEIRIEEELEEGPEEISWNIEELIETVLSAITASDMVT